LVRNFVREASWKRQEESRSVGLLKPGSPLGVAQLYERYKRLDDRTLWKLGELQLAGTLSDVMLEEQWMLKYSQPIRTRW
jgi:hypothetical protein